MTSTVVTRFDEARSLLGTVFTLAFPQPPKRATHNGQHQRCQVSPPSKDHGSLQKVVERPAHLSVITTPSLRKRTLQKRSSWPPVVDPYVMRVPSGVQMAWAFLASDVSRVIVPRVRSWIQMFRSPCVQTTTRRPLDQRRGERYARAGNDSERLRQSSTAATESNEPRRGPSRGCRARDICSLPERKGEERVVRRYGNVLLPADLICDRRTLNRSRQAELP